MRTAALTLRILRQLIHDKRTMGLMIVAPIFVLTLMTFVFNGEDYHPQIAVVNAPQSFVNRLEEQDARVKRTDEAEATEAIQAGRVDAIIDFQHGRPMIKLEGSDPMKSKAVLMLIKEATSPIQISPLRDADRDVTYAYGYKDMSSFDNFGPILIGIFVFFFVFLIAGVSFLRERTFGTLERLLATPIKRWEIVLGYVLGFGFFTIIQSALIAWYSIDVLKIIMVGSFGLVLLVTFLTAMVALTIGTAISAFAENELQMIQFVPIIVIPQVFFSGMFDLSTMSPVIGFIGRLMPLYYSAEALRDIMIRGKGWGSIYLDCIVLFALCVLFMIVNVFALRKYRKI